MPKTRIELPDTIEHLSILNERGELDQTLEPAIPDALLSEAAPDDAARPPV